MQELINQVNATAQNLSSDEEAIAALYDTYAPALYGKILGVVKQKDIAEKILVRVFMNALVDKNISQPVHVRLFTSLLNHSRKKTYGTLKALRMFEACSCGSHDSIAATH